MALVMWDSSRVWKEPLSGLPTQVSMQKLLDQQQKRGAWIQDLPLASVLESWAQTPALPLAPLTCCVASDRGSNFSEPPFPGL